MSQTNSEWSSFQDKNQTADPVSKLIYELSKLPGIGEKTATRLSFFILNQPHEYAQALSDAVLSAKKKTRLCEKCLTYSESALCRICANSQRNSQMICVVERPSDVFSIELTGSYSGVYHVLHGSLSPLDGIGPENLKIRELLTKLQSSQDHNSVQEVILAMNPSVEGDATALYLARLIKPLNIRITKIAYGIPVGGLLEYSDRQTIGKAIENRMEMT